MKKLICEMCGSSELMKQEGVFVCQSCGTKYSVEEAKKMMVEGTVKIDTSDKLDNLYTLARRAKNENNSEEASKYYEQIAVEDPESWEAQFYKVYYSCMQTKIANMGNSCIKLSNTLANTFELISLNVSDKIEQNKAYGEVYEKSLNYSLMIVNNIMSHGKKYSDAANALNFVRQHISGVVVLQVKLGDVCIDAGLKDEALQAYKASTTYFSEIDMKTKESIVQRIKALEPEYSAPATSTGGCYVATAVYGSYDCPQVWTLRRFRDNTLAETWYGRAFIHTYYAISPTLVRWFGDTEWFKKMWKGKLDRMVTKLQSEGVESTPYEDKEW